MSKTCFQPRQHRSPRHDRLLHRDGPAEVTSIRNRQIQPQLRARVPNASRWWRVGPRRSQRLTMQRGRVAGIRLPPIARKPHRQPRHRSVAHHLGDDRGRGDRQAQRVAAHHAAHRAGQLAADNCRPPGPDPAGRPGGRPLGASPAWTACRMFSRRISLTEAAPTPISAVDARNARKAARRCSAVSFLESSSIAASFRGTRRAGPRQPPPLDRPADHGQLHPLRRRAPRRPVPCADWA